MNYLKARAHEDGGWHMTVRNDDQIWVHPCCREPGPPATEDDVEKYGYTLGEPTLGEAHALHATEQEAYDCATAFMRKAALEWEECGFSSWQGCQFKLENGDECDEPTKKGARWPGLASGWPQQEALCDEHRNLDAVLSLVGEAGPATYS